MNPYKCEGFIEFSEINAYILNWHFIASNRVFTERLYNNEMQKDIIYPF